ncbi:MAG TPA: 30S ribosomal protein S5 [Thermoplasmata archaeon]|nr:30S ribosomal protein S5 [Thermoplasmata archaeon]
MNEEWIPKTRLGKMVMSGEITSMGQVLRSGLPIREVEIVDMLLPELEDEVIDVNMVQRMTDSGRRTKFRVVVVVGNKNGYVGIGQAKDREVGMAIRKAVEKAKLNIIEVNRGCGSWECGCGKPHTLPFKVTGKCGSVKITLKPAPKGVGLAVGNVAKIVLGLAGIEDAWGFTKGQTRTTINYAKAVYDALKNTAIYKTPEELKKKLNIIEGAVGI